MKLYNQKLINTRNTTWGGFWRLEFDIKKHGAVFHCLGLEKMFMGYKADEIRKILRNDAIKALKKKEMNKMEKLYKCIDDPNNNGRFAGRIGTINEWKNLNVEWNSESDYVKALDGLDVLKDMKDHYNMVIKEINE